MVRGPTTRRLGAESLQTLSQEIPGGATAKQWVYRFVNSFLTASADAKKKSSGARPAYGA